MKFQNFILINFERMHGRTDGRICPFNFSKVGSIKTKRFYFGFWVSGAVKFWYDLILADKLL